MTSIFRVWRGPCLRPLLALSLLLALSIPLAAQQNAGIIAGSVLDASGAGVDGATVTATKYRHGRRLPNSDDGRRQFPLAEPSRRQL